MKITKLTYDAVKIPHQHPIHPSWFHNQVEKYQYIFIVKLHTDEDIVGYSSMEAPFGLLPILIEMIRYAEPFIVGMDPFQIEQIIWKLRNIARIVTRPWVIENAILDVLGKKCKQPVYKILGAARDRVKVYASWAEERSLQQRQEDVVRLMEEGFKAVKVRFTGKTIQEDIQQIEAIRAVVGDQIEIMVDANQGTALERQKDNYWSFKRARETAIELEHLQCTWLEEPLYRYDFENLSKLSRTVSIPIAGGEINQGIHEFKEIIDKKCFSIIQPNCTMSEGITQIRKIAAMAEVHGIVCNPHAWVPGLGILQSLHLAASIHNCDYLEYPYDPPSLTPASFQGIMKTELKVESDGCIPLPDTPGLGYELDEEKINTYKISL